MAKLVGKYQLVKNEKLVEYFVAVGIPEDKAKKADALKPILEVIIDGKNVTLKTDAPVANNTVTLTLDKEVDEALPHDIILKSTAKLEGDDTLVVNSKIPTGHSGTRVYKVSGSELVVTLTAAGAVTAKRHYKKL